MTLHPELAASIWPPPEPAPSVRKTEPAWHAGAMRAARWAHGLLDLVYPPVCLACACATGTADGLCAACWQATRLIAPPVCARLGTPLPLDLGPGLLSPEAIANPPVFARARAVAHYEGAAQALVHRMKYGDRPDFARVLGAWMTRAGEELIRDADVIVPVPLHSSRLWHRRFNQAALLAREIGRRSGKPVDCDGFRRIKATRSQVGLSRAERADNIQGAFRVAPEAQGRFRDRKVVLVDDVLTTGATANAAARVLLRGGAATVDVLVFARVVTGG